MLTLTVSCKEKEDPKQKTMISLNKKTASVEVGKTIKLKAQLDPKDATDAVAWESSDATIASVDNGKVKGVKEGKATITAKLGNGNSASCEVTVTKKGEKPTPTPEKTTISLDKGSASLKEGETLKLTATLDPETASDAISWESSDKAVATVNNGTVTAVKEGKAKITASLENGNSASCEITVTKKGGDAPKPQGDPIQFLENPIEFEMGDVLNFKEKIKFNPELDKGETVTFEEVIKDNDYKLALVINQRNMTATANRTGECEVKVVRSTRTDTPATVKVVIKEKEFKLPEGAKILICGKEDGSIQGVKGVLFNPYDSFILTHKVVDKDGKDIAGVEVTRTFDEKKLQLDFTTDGKFKAIPNEDEEVEDFVTDIVYTVNGTSLSYKVKVECKNAQKFGKVVYSN